MRVDLGAVRSVRALCAASVLPLVLLLAMFSGLAAMAAAEQERPRMALLPEARAVFSGEAAELLCMTETTKDLDSDSDSSWGNWEVDPEHAAEEVELLFRALRFGYAGYQFFGGDAAFGAAKDAVLREISELSGLYDAIPNWRYLDAITGNLKFVHDAHLAFADRSLCTRSTFRLCPFYEFTRSGQFGQLTGDWRDADGRRLIAVNGEEPSGYLKPSINEDGEIVYILGVMSSERRQDILLELEFEGGNTEMAWLIPAEGGAPGDIAYQLVEFEGLQMAVCETFRSSADNEDELGEFVKDARPFLMTANLRTDTALVLQINRRADTGGQGRVMLSRDEPAEIGDRRRSAAEALIRCLRSTGNVAVVGTNTRGALLTANPGLLRLPYSGLTVRIPAMIWMDHEMRNLDGLGYSPDFWVHPDTADSRAAAFARRYLMKQPVPLSSCIQRSK